MKRSSWVLLVVVLTTASVAQDGGQIVYRVALRSPHETVWQRVDWKTNEVGQAIAQTNAFVELATGLNFFDETTRQWQPSREEWEVYPEAIIARSGQHKVILATNLNLSGAVDVLTPDGVRLISSPVSLAFYDPVDGRQVVIAEVKDCAAERGAAANEIVFRDCFDRIRGSIRYLFTKAGVHQHVVLEQNLELPEGFSDRSRLECYTVFASQTPRPQIQTRVLRGETDPVQRALMVEPDFTDSELSFGESMAMRAGKAFSLSDETDEEQARTIRVGKQFVEIDGLPVLIEAVEFKELEPLLARLASVGQPTTGLFAVNPARQIKRAKEQARLPREHFRALPQQKEIQLASHPLSEPAVVIDYELLTSSTARLNGGMTWFVSGLVNVTNLVIEGTVVVKVTNSPTAKINVTGAIDCQTGPYRPAIFTSQYDTTVGEAIGTGTLTNYPAALVINTSGNVLRDLRFSYAASAVALGFSAGQIQLANVQFVKCQYPIDSAGEEENTIIIDNGLFFSSQYVIRGGEGLTVHGRHLTVNQCDRIGYTGFGSTTGDLYLTNSLVVAATNGWGQFEGAQGSVTTNSTAYFTNDPGGVFQTVGAGSHYLATTNYRNAGTTSINASLLAALKKKTTYPPVELTTNFTANTTLVPQATRDTDTLDLGFHYDPIDFVVSGRTLTNSTLTLTNGVALGNYGASSIAGIYIRKGGNLVSEGSPANLNRIVRYNTAQEQATTNWSAASVADCVNIVADSSPVPQASFRFTAWSLLGRGHYFRSYAPFTTAFIFKDCEFGPGLFDSLSSIAITNCLLDRMHFLFYDDSQPVNYYSYNSFFRGGSLALYRSGSGSWQFKDNLFDQTAISQSGTITHDYNGYITNQNRLTPDGAQDVILTTLLYGWGPLGNFYQTANPSLDNVGSRDAYTAGLFHYTTKFDQVMETNSVVDIGFHSMALNAGVPWDTDADGIPDYADPDSDGNDGLPDWWEQKYMGSLAETPSSDFDGDCLTNLFEYQQGSNPADKPFVTSAPVYQIVRTNVNVTFTVAGGPACVKYQWHKDGAVIAGATNTSLALSAVQLTSNARYSANIYSGAGVTSPAARLVVLDGPAWTIWTNHLAHTNNKTIRMWATNSHPIKTNAPTLAWDTNSLLYGKTGFTAISQANSFQGNQAPVTALTKRHGYTAGHSLTASPYYVGFGGHTGERVWFCTANNQRVEMTVSNSYVRRVLTNGYDYALFIFTEDLTNAITPMAVSNAPSSIGVWFSTGQFGYMSANMPPFAFSDSSKPPFNETNTFQFGDSGSPNMIPTTDGSLVFIKGTTTSGPSEQMQQDMNTLTLYLNLNTNDYKLNWHTNYP